MSARTLVMLAERFIVHNYISVIIAHELTIPTEQQLLVGEVSANVCG
jgi:hypothetical protein